MSVYVLVRPDGSVIEESVGIKVWDVWKNGLAAEMRRGGPRSEGSLTSGTDWPSRCWRAGGRSISISYNILEEIGVLMGYKVALALVSTLPEPTESDI